MSILDTICIDDETAMGSIRARNTYSVRMVLKLRRYLHSPIESIRLPYPILRGILIVSWLLATYDEANLY